MTDDGSEKLETQVMNLLRTRRYDPDILPKLEEFVDHQVAARFIDADANLAVLKLYQFYPQKYNASTVAKILIKALMSLPSPDFLSALYLIPDGRQVDEPIPVISRLQGLLETGRFSEFWETAGSCAELLESVPGAVDGVRAFMLCVIERSYKRIAKKTLGELLDLDEKKVEEVVRKQGWEVTEGVVTVPDNEENQPRPPTKAEQLTFRDVASKMLV